MKTFEQLREIYDAAVMDAWEYGDSHYELGVSEITLGKIHDAARCLEYMKMCESMTHEQECALDGSELAAIDTLYCEYCRELQQIYMAFHRTTMWF